MNGVHDMGGMDGFGKVEPETNEPVFHGAWEARVLALSRAFSMAKEWNIDIGRYNIETLRPDVYLSSSYYERWHRRNEALFIARGLVSPQELEAGHAAGPGRALKGERLEAADIDRVLARSTYYRPEPAAALFKPGDRVRARNIHPRSHTRLPRYVRGHVGTVERLHGCHVYPDAAVAKGTEDPQWLYTVVFEGRDLWGPDSDPTVQVSVDAFEPYLEAV